MFIVSDFILIIGYHFWLEGLSSRSLPLAVYSRAISAVIVTGVCARVVSFEVGDPLQHTHILTYIV